MGEAAADARAAVRGRILGTGFPCLGARSALQQDAYGFGLYGELGSATSAAALWDDLAGFGMQPFQRRTRFTTYIACFRGPHGLDEPGFEALLWQQLQLLHEIDRRRHAWDLSVSSDPGDPSFSFSVAGRAHFVVGLHPRSSRRARRFPLPTLCFNPHAQFEMLRESGRYERFRDRIRARELAWQGSVNPMLRDYGEVSEAAQYSGRHNPPSWTCPLRTSPALHAGA